MPKVVYSFGREDQLDTGAIRRLVAALSRLLSPADALAATAGGARRSPRPAPTAARTSWTSYGTGSASRRSWPASRPRAGPAADAAAAERVLFALVANRALAPSSKLAAAEWMSRDVQIDGLGTVTDDACYRAMDWLHAVRGDLERQVFDQVADLLNLEVDLLFFDTTSTYFEVEDADAEAVRGWRGEKTSDEQDADPGKTAGFRTHGKSKDSRDDLPQIVIGMAVTRDGIPVRVWSWPGNTSDSALIRQVKTDMRDWAARQGHLGRRPRVSSARNRRFLQQGAGGYIIGEKLRTESPLVKAALSRQGRYQQAAGNMQVKEVRLPDATDRLVICCNPDAAERDAAIRAGLISKLEELIAGTDKLTAIKLAELRGKISTMPGLNRFLRVTPGGLLRTDKTKAKAEENLDGKYLLRCADPQLSAEDIAVYPSWTCGRSTTGSKNGSAPRPAVRPCCSPRKHRPPGRRCAAIERIHLGTFTGPAGHSGSAPSCPSPPSCSPHDTSGTPNYAERRTQRP